jgi:hypothetical protein
MSKAMSLLIQGSIQNNLLSVYPNNASIVADNLVNEKSLELVTVSVLKFTANLNVYYTLKDQNVRRVIVLILTLGI